MGWRRRYVDRIERELAQALIELDAERADRRRAELDGAHARGEVIGMRRLLTGDALAARAAGRRADTVPF